MTTTTIAKVTCKNGFTWETQVNGTDESIKKYFLHQYFHTAPFPQEILSEAIAVEIRRV